MRIHLAAFSRYRSPSLHSLTWTLSRVVCFLCPCGRLRSHRGARLQERAGRSLRAPPRVRDSTGAGGENRGGARERGKKKDKSAVMCVFPLPLGLGGGKIFSCKEEEDRSAQVKSGGGGGGRERLGQSPLLSNLNFPTRSTSASLEDLCFPNSYSPKKNCIYINVMLQQ